MEKKITSVMIVSVITNIFLALIKICTGIIYTSGALISDGVHSFSDLITDAVAIIGGRMAMKPADREHPYGHGRIEYLTSLIIGIVIVGVGVGVIYNALGHNIVVPSILVAVISFITIIAKLLLSSYIIHQGKKLNNNILIASGHESRTDVISSIVVLISALLMQLGSVHKYFLYADIIASIIVGLFIIKVGYSVLKENASTVLGEQETDYAYINGLKDVIKRTSGVIKIKDLVLMKYGHQSSLDLTVIMDGDLSLKEAHHIADLLESKIKEYNATIAFINIHAEPLEKSN